MRLATAFVAAAVGLLIMASLATQAAPSVGTAASTDRARTVTPADLVRCDRHGLPVIGGAAYTQPCPAGTRVGQVRG